MPPLVVAVQDLAAHRGARIEIVCAWPWPEAVTLDAGSDTRRTDSSQGSIRH